MEVFFVGFGLALLVGWKLRDKKMKKFVCGHCECEDTLQTVKLRDKDVFTCSFCGRIVDEDLLRLQYKQDYDVLKNTPEKYEEFKKARREGKKWNS